MASKLYDEMQARCQVLIDRYLQPHINAEDAAKIVGGDIPLPDYNDISAFRLLAHAELEGFLEDKATEAVNNVQKNFDTDIFFDSQAASLVFLHLWKKQTSIPWAKDSDEIKAGRSLIKSATQDALGFARKFIKENNGIKENSFHTLAALTGRFPDTVDPLLTTELNQYGRKRGDVAHKSWSVAKVVFDSAEVERNSFLKILELIKDFDES